MKTFSGVVGSPQETKMANVTKSAIQTDDLSEDERLRMCRRALRNVEYDYRFVTFLQKEKTERCRLYALHSDVGERLVGIEVVEAFKCPTKPALYIHVNNQHGNRGRIWIIIKDKKTEPGFEGAVYNMQTVKNIVEGKHTC